MAVLDLEKLLQPVSPDMPCGENLEYDAEVIALEALVRGKGEQQFGDTVIPGEEPDWREVGRAARALLQRTADLRIAVHLARALLKTDGLAGLADAASLARGWLEQRWDHVHPQLDPEDGDATMRVNAVGALAHADTVLRDLRLAPLVRSRNIGVFSLRDCQMAAGDIPVPEGQAAPEPVTIEAAFADVPVEDLQATADAIATGIAALDGIEATLNERLGAGMGADLSGLTQLLRAAGRIVGERLASRGVAVAGGEVAVDTSAAHATGEIRSREDVARLLDRACAYFRQHEPSSPVPHLLERAKRLIFMDFKEILQDLAPGGVAEFETISGRKDEATPAQ